jgi:hypothetical protein
MSAIWTLQHWNKIKDLRNQQLLTLRKIRGFNSGDYQENRLLGCGAV